MRYSPSELSTVFIPNTQIYINIPRKNSVISLIKSYIILKFDVFHAANRDSRYADNIDLRLVNLGAIALLNKYKLTTSSGKHLQ